MADEKAHDLKSLEMRLAAIEDKLAKLNITEDEMKAYEKVSALIGGSGGAQPVQALSPQVCQISRQRLVCIISRIRWAECNECGPCAGPGGGFSGGGGFGGFGM